MNRGTLLPEMLHCTEMTVLERQRARLKWQLEQLQQPQQQQQLQQQQEQQQQQEVGYFSELSQLISQGYDEGGLMMGQQVKPDPAFENGWRDLGKIVVPAAGYGFGPGFEASYAISRTSSCPPAVASEAVNVKGKVSVAALNDKVSAVVGRESFKKRKADKVQNTKVAVEENAKDKRMKGSAEEGDSSKITEQNNNNNKSNSNNNNNNNNRETSADTSKASEVQKPDYIHVRARRGQATDSHSLAERVRREKISERMKYLQDLVPGCNKITGKAGMLDEIINYVQSLQRQVEFLSMKLAAVNPRLDFNFDSSFAKEAFPACPSNFPTIGMSSEMTNPAAYLHQFNSLQQQVVSCSGLDLGIINPSDMGLRRTISAPVSVPETFIDSSCFPQLQLSSNWDSDLQNFYNVASFPAQQFTGTVEASNLKMEM